MAIVNDISVQLHSLLSYLAALLVLWMVGNTVYLRFFHPLAKVPGPFLASISESYRFYYDYVRNGSFYLHFERLRDQYGPVIRIAPNEVLLTDPDNYDKIYSMNSKFSKDPSFYHLSGANTALFAITSNEDHRRHRTILNPFFSRRSVLEQESVVQRKVAKLLSRIVRDSERGTPTDISIAFRAISIDVITEYAFGVDRCWGSLDREDLGVWYHKLSRSVVPMMYVFKLVPALQAPMQAMPLWIAKKLNPLVAGMMEVMELMRKEIEKVIREVSDGMKPERETIFHTVLNPDAAGDPELEIPTVQHMIDEAFGMVAAAAETAGNAMTICAFHVLFNQDIYVRLRQELLEAFPDPTQPVDYLTLEKLPYLTAVVKEGLRLSYGVLHPLPRVVPDEGAVFNGCFLSQGTVVCMSSWLMHRDPSAFPDPERFDPERWLDPDQSRFRERFLTPFSKGNRMCIGQPLALCELYVSIGQIFRKFANLAPIDVGPEDMVYEDYFGAFHPENARKFRVLLVPEDTGVAEAAT